jgi:NADH-quinone oxidoreductase subunit N
VIEAFHPSALPVLALQAPPVGALLRAIVPELILTVGILALVLAEAFLTPKKRFMPRLSLAFVAVTFFVQAFLLRGPEQVVGPLRVDDMAWMFRLLFLASGLVTILFGMRRSQDWFEQGEFHVLLLGSLIGMSVLSAATDVVTAYLAFELVSYSGYLMVGYRKGDRAAGEAGIKYVVFGSVASGAMLFGLSWLVGLGGTTSMEGIAAALSVQGASPAALAAAVFVFAGIAFKVSAVPFHFWAPDAYEGAPSMVAGFLAVASKAAGFAVAVRILASLAGPVHAVPEGTWFAFLPSGPVPHWIVGVAAVATMIVGNTAALHQRDLRRILAWSSIAHAGYLLMALSVANGEAVGAVIVYFWIYLLMTLGGFGIIGLMKPLLGGTELRHYNGLIYRRPGVAIALAILMISLAGLPPTAGFWGKVLLFKVVIDAKLYGMAVVGLLTSAISLYYYAGLLRAMFLVQPAEGAQPVELEFPDWCLIAGSTVPLLVAGIYGFSVPATFILEAAKTWLLPT